MVPLIENNVLLSCEYENNLKTLSHDLLVKNETPLLNNNDINENNINICSFFDALDDIYLSFPDFFCNLYLSKYDIKKHLLSPPLSFENDTPINYISFKPNDSHFLAFIDTDGSLSLIHKNE